MTQNPQLRLIDNGIPATASEEAGADGAGRARGGRRQRAATEPLTSKQRLSATIKSVRDSLRKDRGLSGDTDRLPQLTWLLFLKMLDDFELAQQAEWGSEYEPMLEAPYRWRDWAAVGTTKDRMTGDELIDFVNNRLIPHLSRLSGAGQRDLRTIVGAIFQGTDNRIRSGYILREVVDRLSIINFNSSDDIHTISHFYETMLREMRDAADDAGEFYTPRPVVRFIVDRLAPKLGERVLDPACGTGGFLVETYERLKEQARDPEQRKQLQRNIIGIEKKPMPYLLGVTNLLMHGFEHPSIVERNVLQTNIRDIKDSERVDVVATNPPFGGEEELGILNNFPVGLRCRETAILFFQYIMATLKRPGGRCGIVLPDGFLFGTGIAAEVKKQLLERFNLHTIVRLPKGVFEPYTDIRTNLLFFDVCATASEGPSTREVWYYAHPLPEARKMYTKTMPLQYDEFAPCLDWWDNREENECAWLAPVERIVESGYNLDIKNPNSKQDNEHTSPEQLAEEILRKERRIVEIVADIIQVLGRVAQ